MGLPVHYVLASMTDRSRTQVSAADSAPNCSICEDDDKVTATNYCSTCDMFYCETCFNTLHPMKGKLKQHQMLTIEEFVVNQKSVKAFGETKNLGDSGQVSVYENHSETYCLFCYTCEQLMCVECFGEHDKHTIGGIKSACDSYKPPFEKRSSDLKHLKEEVEKFLGELEKLNSDIQIRKEHYKTENTWHRKCLDDIDKQHDEWTSECKIVITDLNSKLTDMEILIKSSQELLSGLDLNFLENLKEIQSRLESTSVSVKSVMKRDREMSKTLDKNLDKVHTIPECTFPNCGDVLFHILKFQEKQSDYVDIRENGSTLVNVEEQHWTSEFPGALTDGKFQSGKHYWEVNFTFTRKRGRLFPVYTAGVVQNSSSLSWCVHVGDDDHSWGIQMWWCNAQYQYSCHHKNKYLCNEITVFLDHPTSTGTVRHGFYLNCDKQTLTVTDCTHKRVLHRFNDIDISQPLTPAVTLHNNDYCDVTARLVPTTMSSVMNTMLVVKSKRLMIFM